MTISQKAVLSFLLSVFLLTGIAIFAQTGLFGLIESRFHNPAAEESIIRETAQDAEILNGIVAGMHGLFLSLLEEPLVCRGFNPNQNAAVGFELSGIFGLLMESVPGLLSVRFIDADGSRILFSTYFEDIIQSNETEIVYRSYNAVPFSLPFGDIAVPAQGKPKLTLDKGNMEMIFSYPFYDASGYLGIAAITVTAEAFRNALIAEGRMDPDKNIAFCPRPAGIIGGMPDVPADGVYAAVVRIWTGKNRAIVPFTASGANFCLVSSLLPVADMDQGFYYGRIIDDALLAFAKPQRAAILISIFLTVFLFLFLLLNVKQKPAMVFKNNRSAVDGIPAVRESSAAKQKTETWPKSAYADAPHNVIFEKDGIPYISSELVSGSANPAPDKNFAKLVEAVAGKNREPNPGAQPALAPPVPQRDKP